MVLEQTLATSSMGRRERSHCRRLSWCREVREASEEKMSSSWPAVTPSSPGFRSERWRLLRRERRGRASTLGRREGGRRGREVFLQREGRVAREWSSLEVRATLPTEEEGSRERTRATSSRGRSRREGEEGRSSWPGRGCPHCWPRRTSGG